MLFLAVRLRRRNPWSRGGDDALASDDIPSSSRSATAKNDRNRRGLRRLRLNALRRLRAV